MINDNKLADWCKRVLFQGQENETPVVKFVLCHMSASNRPTPVKTFMASEGDGDTIARLLSDYGEEDANKLGQGMQKYGVYVHTREGEKIVQRERFIFRVDGQEDEIEESDGTHTEPANGKGLLGQMMRHNEGLMRISAGSTGNIIDMQNRIIMQQAGQIERLQTQLYSGLEAREQMISEAHMRGLEEKKMAFELEAKQELYDKANILVPTIVNYITGKKLLPEHSSPQQEMLKSFMGSLTEEQMMALGQVLRPEQIIPIVKIYEDFKKQEEEKTKKREAFVKSDVKGPNGQGGAS